VSVEAEVPVSRWPVTSSLPLASIVTSENWPVAGSGNGDESTPLVPKPVSVLPSALSRTKMPWLWSTSSVQLPAITSLPSG